MKNVSLTRFLITISMLTMVIYLVSCNRSKNIKELQSKVECYKFADQHWIEEDYRQWLIDNLGITSGSDQDSFWNREKQSYEWLPHHLPDKKDQQYYELIGKYDQFMSGWDDFREDDEQKHRNEYLECLDRAIKSKKLSPIRPE